MRLIDADKLEYVLAKHQAHYYGDSDYYEGISQGFNLARYDVKEAPTIEAEPVRHGHWNIVEGMPTQCSCCGYYVKQKTYKYCPYCGARMEGVEE